MSTRLKAHPKRSKKTLAKSRRGVENESETSAVEPRCLAVAQSGVKTAADFSNYMSALMSDLIDGRVTPQVGNACCNAGGKLLKMVELQYKYGNTAEGKPDRTLRLASG